MVNFRGPSVIQQDDLVVVKFWHTLAGLYIWEFVTTLGYEWSVIRGRRPYRWTMVIYSVTRVASLMEVILTLITFNVTGKCNCQVEVVIEFIFAYLAFAAASLLVVLRIIAIWNMNKLVIAIATGIWVTNLAFLTHSTMQVRSSWVPAEPNCTVNILSTRLSTITTFITDILLLFIMLVGLLRLGFHQSGVFGLGHLMWRQGLIWLFLATIAYIPPVVFISLNLNDSLDNMFQLPPVIMISIAATRIYRSLMDCSARSTDIAIIIDKLHPIDFITSKSNRDPAQPVVLEYLMEAEHHKTFEQYLTSQNASSINADGSPVDNPAGQELDYEVDLESVAESQILAPQQ